MIETYRKIYSLLDSRERRRAGILLALFMAQGIFETLGVASIMPFMAAIAEPNIVASNPLLAELSSVLGFSEHRDLVVFLGFLVFLALVLSLSVSAVTQWAMFRFVQMCNYGFSKRLLGVYFRRTYSWFLQQHSSELGKNVLSEVERLIAQVVMPSVNLLSRVVVAVFLIGIVVLVDPLIALYSILLLGGLYVLVFVTVRKMMASIGRNMYQANEARFKASQESFSGIKDIKVFGLESIYLNRYLVPARKYARNNATSQILALMPRYLLEATAFGGMLIVVIYLLMTEQQGLGGALPMIALYAMAGFRLMPALQAIYHSLSNVRTGGYILENLYPDLVDSKVYGNDPLSEKSSSEPRLEVKIGIELKNITFSYPGSSSKALSDLNATILANTTVAFVGTTGSGKTTLVDILLGLLEPDAGQVCLDGRVITGDMVHRLRRNIGYVPQEIYLTDDTIAANIAFGSTNSEIDLSAVQNAARIAELHDFVSQLPDDYQTRVGERGVLLSGGQRQRIGISRALYHDPQILVFDEATSALDNLTEQAVMTAIRNLGHMKTVIMIAHRLSTVRNCDQIFLLDEGRILAHGTFNELRSSSLKFRKMSGGE